MSDDFQRLQQAGVAADPPMYIKVRLCDGIAGQGYFGSRYLVTIAAEEKLADQYLEEGASQYITDSMKVARGSSYDILLMALEAAPHGVANMNELLHSPILQAGAKFRCSSAGCRGDAIRGESLAPVY